MGMSANQARFLSLTSRQVDLEYRMQQICHRRLRLASELEKVATTYNNKLSDRKLFSSTNTMYEAISLDNLEQLGYKVLDNTINLLIGDVQLMKVPPAPDPAATVINSEEEFLNLVSVMNGNDAAATTALAGNYVLNCNIDLSNNGSFNDAVIEDAFTGTFDGQGYTISGLTINSSQSRVGLFSEISSSGTVSNLKVSNADITSSSSNIGVLAGYITGTIENCGVSGTISGNSYAGGLVGYNNNGDIIDSFAQVDVSTNGSQAGGLVGYNSGSAAEITRSYATGDASGTLYVGGLVGQNYNDAIITDSYATGNATGTTYVGGLVGRLGWGTISNSYATGAATGNSEVGGFVGMNYPTSGRSNIDNTNFWNTDIMNIGIETDTTGEFYAQGLTTEEIANGDYTINGGWNPAIWDMSGSTPVLQGSIVPSDLPIEEGLRNGTYTLVRQADNYTQSPINFNGIDYEKADWRTVSYIDDDLDTSNDVEAENEYESAVEKINSQDKKLQLEQSQIEVEHKAIITERDAVKNLINKNIESSFKTFS